MAHGKAPEAVSMAPKPHDRTIVMTPLIAMGLAPDRRYHQRSQTRGGSRGVSGYSRLATPLTLLMRVIQHYRRARAWVRHKDIHKGPERDVRWLTDLLPKTFREYQPSIGTRIFCFNYQSAWLGPQLSRNRLENVATRLLDSIQSVRDKVSSA